MKPLNSLLVAVAAILLCASSLSAQDLPPFEPNIPAPAPEEMQLPRNAVVYHHELFAGYGTYSNYDVMTALTKVFSTMFSMGAYRERNMRMTGTVSAGYKYMFDRVASLGATYSYGSMSGDVYRSGDDYWGRSTTSHHTLAIECDFRYLTRRLVTLYSTVGLGGTFVSQTVEPDDPGEDKETMQMPGFDFQLSLIGVKVGGYRFGGFAELGVGYKGMLNFGAYVRF